MYIYKHIFHVQRKRPACSDAFSRVGVLGPLAQLLGGHGGRLPQRGAAVPLEADLARGVGGVGGVGVGGRGAGSFRDGVWGGWVGVLGWGVVRGWAFVGGGEVVRSGVMRGFWGEGC